MRPCVIVRAMPAALLAPMLWAQPVLDSSPAGPLIAIDGPATPAIYAGRFRSLDQGATWSAYYLTAPGLEQPPLHALLVDPGEPATLYYASTAERGGVWRSTDKAATWTAGNTGLPGTGGAISELFAATREPFALYARIGGAVYRSADRARTWRRQSTLPGSGGIFRITPGAPATQFYVQRGVVWRSEDEGATWNNSGAIPVGPPGESFTNSVVDLATEPANPQMVFATETGPWFAAGGRLYWAGFWKSVNRGVSWDYMGGASRWILVDPSGANNIYVTAPETPGIQKSVDRGANWKTISIFPGTVLGGTRLAAAAANPRTIYAATPRGVHRSDDAAETWRALHGPVRATLALPETSPRFHLAPGGSTTWTFRLRALEKADWAMQFTARVEGGAWLRVSPESGATPAVLTATMSAAGLSPGVYRASLRLESPHAAHGPLDIPFELTVSTAAAGSAYVISTIAGRGTAGSLGDGGPALSAAIVFPYGAAKDAARGVLVADTDQNRIRLVSPDGIIRTVAGTGVAGFSGDGGPAASAQLNHPRRVLPDASGGYFIADYGNHRVRKVDASGVIRTFTDAVRNPSGLALDAQGNLYVSSWGEGNVRRFTPAGAVTATYGAPLYQMLRFVEGVAVDSSGAVLIAEAGGHRVHRLEGGVFRPIAGTGTGGYNGDGQPAGQAQLNSPGDVSVDGRGNIYIADSANHRIRMIDSAGWIHTIAGTGAGGFSGDGGPATAARLNRPAQVEPDGEGNLIVADRWNYRIRKLEPQRADAPRVAAGGVVNAASFDSPVAPGSLISIFGENLARSTEAAASTPWPSSLGGARVRVGGRDAPIYYASPGQLNAQLPYEIPPGPATLTVTTGGVTSATAQVDVAITAPGILQYGAGRAVAQNQDGGINTADAPAAPGSVVVVYLTGIGPVDNAVATGAAASASPLSRAVAPHAATLSGIPAQVIYLGLAPGFVGLAQANILIPELPPGDHPLIVLIGESQSNTALLAVGAPAAGADAAGTPGMRQ